MEEEIHYWRYGLRLKSGGGGNAASARRVLEGMLIRVDGGYGGVHPWPEFGEDPLSTQWGALRGRRPLTALLERSLACARLDGAARREGRSLFAGRRIPESHAILPGGAASEEVFRKLKIQGFVAVKLKGGRDWRGLLDSMRLAQAAGLRVRLDFNGVLGEKEFLDFAAAARRDGLAGIVDFVEDPVPYDAAVWRRLAAESAWRLALDWLPGGVEEASLKVEESGFDLRVIKPASRCMPRADGTVPLVITSAMDHPLGQLFAAYEAAEWRGNLANAGLLTHRLFEEDSFTERLGDCGPGLRLPGGTGLGFDDLLENLPWRPVFRKGQRGRPGVVLENPRAPLAGGLPSLREGELGFPTSGSTGHPAVIVHRDDSLEASAASVNAWLAAGCEDVWLRVLPLFHVGGRQIHTRAELAGSRVVEREEKWDAGEFVRICAEEGVSLASLVPAQVYDLVKTGRGAPPLLRAVLVGGGALEAELWGEARALGWPLLPSYGCTEGASTVAAAGLEALDGEAAAGMPEMELLPGWEAWVTAAGGEGNAESLSGLLELRGPALAEERLVFSEGIWHRERLRGADTVDGEGGGGGWWRTADRVTLRGRVLGFSGRADRVVKVLGELVNLAELEKALAAAGLEWGSFAVLPRPEERRGHELWLMTERDPDPEALRRYEENAVPFARLRGFCRVPALPRSPLGKIRYAALEEVAAGGIMTPLPGAIPLPGARG